MTEAEWWVCEDIPQMIVELESKNQKSFRKFRLFAVGCCRRIWSELHDVRSKAAVDMAERYADGYATQNEMRAAFLSASDVVADCKDLAAFSEDQAIASYLAAGRNINESATKIPLDEDAIEMAAHVWSYAIDAMSVKSPLQQIHLLRDIFGNPFRPVALDPAWLTPTAVALANSIYADRSFDRMPILADALEEAGCDNADVLLHCRGNGPHVKGCWVVDLVLGKV